MLKKGKAVIVLFVRVTKRYVDKYTKEIVYPSDESMEVVEERANELIEAGVAEQVKKTPAKKAE